jgi:hypothetical protein
MWMATPRLSRVCGIAAIGLLGVASADCKRRDSPPSPSPVPSVVSSAPPTPEQLSRCRRRADFGLALDAQPAPPPNDADATEGEDENDDALLPFGVDIGVALPTPFGFAVTGMHGTAQAFVALLAERASRRIDLGELHGDAETPAIAAVGERLIVALRSTDAAGFTIKLGSIAGPESGAAEWGFELTRLGKVVTGVELAADGKRGVLVYQGEVKGDARLMLGSFASDDLTEPFTTKPLEAKDVEMPRLVRRPGGYWLSWVRTLPELKKAPVPSNGGRSQQDPEERELLEVGLRVVEVAKLDDAGNVVGAALRVGEPRRQVLLYDVAAVAGGLLVATRSDSASPGAEGGAILLSQVAPDGSVHDARLDDDEIGAGAPTLLVDRSAGMAAPWLAVSALSDATRIGLVQGARTQLYADPLLGRAEVIAVDAGRFLLQRARGRGVTLETLDCAWPAPSIGDQK